MVTNFFHGCIFALKERKPFACVTTPYRAHKVRDLTALIGASDRLVAECAVATLPRLLCEQPAPAIFRRIADLRRQSDAYLDRALA